MDSIPNEILLPIIGSLGEKEVPKMRLVSSRFNLLATECVQKLYRVKFTEDSDIAKFVTMFENKAVVPFERFEFTETLLVYGQPLEQFCLQFGKIVKYWEVLGYNCPESLGGNSLSKNTQILLENCDNVEEISIKAYRDKELGKFTNIPVFRNLKTITVSWFDMENKEFLPLLHQIVENAPNLQYVPIDLLSNCMASFDLVIFRDILNQLHKMNGIVHIKELMLFTTLDLLLTNIGDLQKLFTISTKFNIVELDLHIFEMGRDPEQLPQQVELLSRWIQQLTTVRTFNLTYSGSLYDNALDLPQVPIALPNYLHANVECLYLKVKNLALYVPVPSQPTEFPALTVLVCNLRVTNNFIFSGCVFPNVKIAQIYLNTEEECEEWPRMLPNVEELFVSSKTLKGIFRFPKLWKLDISIDSGSNPDDYRQVRKEHWKNLTGRAISNRRIGCFRLKYHDISMETFRNLPLLTHLRFTNETVECWKGIVYARRTGQLRCLEKLTFSQEFIIEEPYHTELMMLQPLWCFRPCPLTEFGFREMSFFEFRPAPWKCRP